MVEVDYSNPFIITIGILSLCLLIAIVIMIQMMIRNSELKKDLVHADEDINLIKLGYNQLVKRADKYNNDLLQSREKNLVQLKKIQELETEILRKEGVIQMQKQSMDADAKKPQRRKPTPKE